MTITITKGDVVFDHNQSQVFWPISSVVYKEEEIAQQLTTIFPNQNKEELVTVIKKSIRDYLNDLRQYP